MENATTLQEVGTMRIGDISTCDSKMAKEVRDLITRGASVYVKRFGKRARIMGIMVSHKGITSVRILATGKWTEPTIDAALVTA